MSTGLIPPHAAVVLKLLIDGRWGQNMRSGSGTDLRHQREEASNVSHEDTGSGRQHFVTFVNICEIDVSAMTSSSSNTPDPQKVFSEKLNGRAAMLGLMIGLAVEAVTGKGIIQQVWGFNESTKGIDFSGLLSFFS